MTNDVTILSCPQCGFPLIRDCGNGLYQCDDCGTHFDKNENIVQTNEEWFCGLSTEEKAEVLFDIWYDGKVLAWDKSKPFYFNRFVTWLKEVHKDEM